MKEGSVVFNYRFQSGLGCYEHGRFVREVTSEIILVNDSDQDSEKIGQIDFLIIYIDQTYDSDFSLYDILDAHSEYLARHIFKIIDYKTGSFISKLENFYDFEIHGSNVCLIQKITVLPEYRGYKIGAKAIKDLIFHYSSGCGLFALQPFPLQFEAKISGDKDLDKGLETFEKNQKKANAKLKSYYKSIGFEEIKGVKDLMFYNPAVINEKFSNLDLEEDPFIK